MRRLLPLLAILRPLRARLALLGALMLLTSLSEGLGLGLFYPLLDYVQHAEAFLARPAARPVVWLLARLGLEPSVGGFIALIFLAILATLALKYAVFRLSARVYNPFMKSLRDEAFARVLSSHLFCFTGSSSAHLSQILENEVEYAGQALNFSALIAASLLSLCVYVAFLLALSWRLTLLVAAIGAARYLVSGLFIRRMRAIGEEHGRLRTWLKSRLTAIHQGIDVVKTFGAEAREEKRFRELTERIRQNAEEVVSAQGGHAFWEGILGDGLLCLIVYAAVSRMGISGAALLTFLFIVSRVIPKVTAINDGRIRVAEYLGRISLLPRTLSAQGLPALRWGNSPKPSFEEEIRFAGVCFRYPEAEGWALRDIGLALRKGESLAVVGESGAGKSTLARLLLRLFDPTEGRITADGVALPELRRQDWTRLVSVVSQDTFIFDDTLENNVKYGAPACSEEEFREALRRSRCQEFVERLPRKEKTELGERGVRLSGGQRQRIAIARAFLRGSPLLILDEATSSLDSETERLIQEALRELSQDKTLLIIAHRLSTIREADRIVVLERGRIAEAGTHAELVARGGLYRRFHELQAR